MNSNIRLDERLSEVVKLLGANGIVVDVGCDHGYVANYLVEEDLADLVYATDISGPSLEKNREYAKIRGNNDKVISILGDGLIPIRDKNFDAVIMAGMGGELIIKILAESKDIIRDKVLVLQPMTARVELRKYLVKNGFRIDTESIVKDCNKYYEIIRAVPGIDSGSNCSYYFGKNLVEDCNPVLMDYVRVLLEKNVSYIEQAKKSKSDKSRDQRLKLLDEIGIFKGVLNGCES